MSRAQLERELKQKTLQDPVGVRAARAIDARAVSLTSLRDSGTYSRRIGDSITLSRFK